MSFSRAEQITLVLAPNPVPTLALPLALQIMASLLQGSLVQKPQ